MLFDLEFAPLRPWVRRRGFARDQGRESAPLLARTRAAAGVVGIKASVETKSCVTWIWWLPH